MQKLDALLGRIGLALSWAAGTALLVMMLQVFLDVAGRYLLGKPMPSTLEIVSEWWMPALIFLPLLDVERRGENIAVDILHQRLGNRGRNLMEALGYVCFALFLALISYGAFQQAMRAMAEGEFIVGMIPVVTWPARFFLPIAGGLTALLSLLRAVRALIRAVQAQAGDGDAPASAGQA